MSLFKTSPPITILYVLVAFAGHVGLADEFNEQRQELDARFATQLEEVADTCDRLKLDGQAAILRRWIVPRGSDRQYIFLPAESDPHAPSADASRNVQFWHRKFSELRTAHAAELFTLATRLIAADEPTRGYQLLHEVLRQNPDHPQAREVLGYRQVNGRWRRIGAEPRTRTLRVGHPLFGWRAGGYRKIESEHFEITTDATAETGLELAATLEQLYDVWKQVFFLHWNSGPALQAQLARPGTPTRSARNFKVTLFHDRNEYITQLRKYVPGVEISNGYYDSDKRESYFFAGDPAARSTWLHEATHQLFQETGRSVNGAGRDANFWFFEGVAMYMESLREFEDYVTVGGFDASRLQYARYRALNFKFQTTLEKLCGMSAADFQKNEAVRTLYSESAGLTHFLMDGNHGAHRPATIQFLEALYTGRSTPASLSQLTTTPFANLDKAYREFLVVTDADLTTRLAPPPYVSDLALGYTEVSDAGLTALTSHNELTWLDLAYTATTDAGTENLTQLKNLTRLNLEGTQITDAALETIASLTILEALDLSDTAITDAGLAKLSRLTQLKELWLANTQTGDAGLQHLHGLKQLESVGLNQTRITQQGLTRLRAALPKWTE